MSRGDELIEAAKTGDEGRVRRLIAEDPPLVAYRAASGETPLMAALYRGHRRLIDVLVEFHAPLDVFAAAALGRIATLRDQLAANPSSVQDVAYDGWTALHLAAFFGSLDAVRLLLDAGAPISAPSRNSLRNTPLHAATAGRHDDVALLLLERGAPVDVRDAGGHTPLHIAAESGSVEVVRALLARGADPHAVDAEEQTPLSRAAARNHTEVIDAINLRG